MTETTSATARYQERIGRITAGHDAVQGRWSLLANVRLVLFVILAVATGTRRIDVLRGRVEAGRDRGVVGGGSRLRGAFVVFWGVRGIGRHEPKLSAAAASRQPTECFAR